MTREVALSGLVAVVFGLGSYYATKEFGVFAWLNLGLGSAALVLAALVGARRLRLAGGPHSRRIILRGLGTIALAVGIAVSLERVAATSEIRFDWTFERSFDLSDATRKALAELPGELTATLFYDELDPRKRRSKLLLETLAHEGNVRVELRVVDEDPEAEDRFEVQSSNTVVLQLDDRFETVPRPTEGAIYEALYRLRSANTGVITLLRGEGEGDPESSDDLGYSGLATALATEGYEVRTTVAAAMEEVPAESDVVLLISPRRPLLEASVDALRRYLERGGSLVVLLDPGVRSGVEDLLGEYGITAPDSVVIDPASGTIDSGVPGIDVIAYNYERHPITRGLDRNRMTFFPGARAFQLRKPRPDDDVRRVVLSSPRSWLDADPEARRHRAGTDPAEGVRQDYQSLVAAGRYPRPDGEARIVAFGDSGIASNRYLRALYNLDLVLNAIHWSAQRETEITLRPKIRDTIQFPLPVASTLGTLYGVGLLLPELLLIAAGIVWIRRLRG